MTVDEMITQSTDICDRFDPIASKTEFLSLAISEILGYRGKVVGSCEKRDNILVNGLCVFLDELGEQITDLGNDVANHFGALEDLGEIREERVKATC